MVTRVTISMPGEIYERMEAARGDITRSRWILRALEEALGAPVREDAPGGPAKVRATAAGSSPSPASPRMPSSGPAGYELPKIAARK